MSKNLTIKDIAVLANTSKTTVSFYLNGKFDNMSTKTKDKIEEVIKKYNYVPNTLARSLSTKKTNLIGVLVGDITNSFSNQLVKGIEKNATKKGYEIIIGNSNYDFKKEKNFIEKLIQMGVAGFIIQPTKKFKKNLEFIQSRNRKITFVDSQVEEKNVQSVKTDNYNSTYNCIKSIKDKGNYDSYIMIGGEISTLSTRKERAEGFFDSTKKESLHIVVSDNACEDEVREKLLNKLDFNKKTLVFVPNCWLLPTVYKVLSEYKEYIPEKIGIVGFDNLEWTNFVMPTVTTIVQPAFEEGYQAVEKLVYSIENDADLLDVTTLMCDINWKESVKL